MELFDPACGTVQAGAALDRCRRAPSKPHGKPTRGFQLRGCWVWPLGQCFPAPATSSSFRGGYEGSYASLSVQPVAKDEGGKNRTAGYWTGARSLGRLEDDLAVGREAARRTVRMLGAKKVPTGNIPVVFDQDAARSMLGTFAGCIVGDAIYGESGYSL